MKLRGTFIFSWKVLDYEFYRPDLLQLANDITVLLRLAIGRRAGSNLRVLSRKVAGSKPLLLFYCLLETSSRKFLVSRKNSNPLVDDDSKSSVP